MPAQKHSRRSARRAGSKPRRWSAAVTTDSTHPPPGLFTKRASRIAAALASKEVSPKGPVSGLRMLIFFINRAGKGLSASRRNELEKAKALLSNKIHAQAERRKGKVSHDS